jgi:hypothetical protein
MNVPTLTTEQVELMIVIAVVLVAGIVALVYLRKRRTERLRNQFGESEYTRVVEKTGDKRTAEASLEKRAERVQKLNIRPLSAADRGRFLDAWRGIQARFVDGPAGAVAEADQLLADVMYTRGYPVSDFEQRAADISVDHAQVVENYRAAHEIALRQSRGQTSTEDLRQAMVHYRTLFEDLINEPASIQTKALAS